MILPKNILLPARTIHRVGAIVDLVETCSVFGKRGVVVHGASFERSGMLAAVLDSVPAGLSVSSWRHPGNEPSLTDVENLLETARTSDAQWIAGVGGGSVIDVSKAAAGLFNCDSDMVSYHNGQTPERVGIPFIAVPTTAGTGSEATPNSVLTNSSTSCKKSIRADSYMAEIVILDPDLLASCPKNVVASSGMDALTQAIEAFVSANASWFSDELTLKACSMISSSIIKVYAGKDRASMDRLLVGSYLAGMGLCNARLGVVHGLAHPLGARYHLPHGLVCAACLPHALEFNREAMGNKYDILSNAVNGDLLEVSQRFCEQMDIRSPFSGKDVMDREKVIAETCASGSTAANPKPVTPEDVEWFLDRLFG